jgi:antitoxin PrlF
MNSNTYPLTPAKIGNASGFRLPAAFYRDHPQFVNASGTVELIDDRLLLVKLAPNPSDRPENDEHELMLSLFLDLISKDILQNPTNLEPYTEAMSQADEELLTGVNIE